MLKICQQCTSLNPQNNSRCLYYPHLKENCTTKPLSNWPKVTQPVREGVKPRLESGLWNHCLQDSGLVEGNGPNETDPGPGLAGKSGAQIPCGWTEMPRLCICEGKSVITLGLSHEVRWRPISCRYLQRKAERKGKHPNLN